MSLESFLTLPLLLSSSFSHIAPELDYNSIHLVYQLGQNALTQDPGLVCLTRSNPLRLTLVHVP